MGWTVPLVVLLGGAVGLMMLGLPVAFAFLAIDILGVFLWMGGPSGIEQLLANATSTITTFVLVPVPLFVLMGSLFFHSGLARRVFDAVDLCIGGMRGRLCYLTVATGTLFAALSGSSMANTAMLGSLMVPEMTRRGYAPRMAMGPILGTGGLAILIPPSTLAVLLASLARIDVGALLVAGLLPGLLLAAFYILTIRLQLWRDPAAAPPDPDRPAVPLGRKLRALLFDVAPTGIVVFCVVGLIILGVATPSEAAAFGAVSVFALAVVFRALTVDAVLKATRDAVRITGMAFLILIGSSTFSQLLAFSGATSGLVGWAAGLDLPPLAMLAGMVLVLLALGMFMDQLSMMLLTLPVFVPLAHALGFEPVWFGVIVLLTLEIGLVTPPFGLLLFVMAGAAPPGTSAVEVARSALPYIACALLLLLLIVAFPQIALFVPSLLR